MFNFTRKKNRSFYKKLLMSFRRMVRKTKKFAIFYLKKSGFIRDRRKKLSVSRQLLFKFVPAMLIFILMAVVLTNVSPVNAYYNDTESSVDNIFSVSLLDFLLTNDNLETVIGPEALGEISHASVIMPEDDSLPMQYILTNNILNEDSGLCGKLIVEAKLNGISQYIGSLSGLAQATSTEFGTWEFHFDMLPLTVASQGDKCQGEIIFQAWRADVADPNQSGYTDEEKINFSFTARMIVLNEIFARPATGGVAPKNKEYIELYNNGDTPVDVLGWQISEISGTSTEVIHTIVTSTTSASQLIPYNGTSTIIVPGGYLVLRFGGSASYLNDSGDTVRLYDASSFLLDSHTYSAVTASKSVVRFPDGIGFWVDPDPTPGQKNTVTMEDLKLAGFDDEMIAQIMVLVSLKNESLATDQIDIVPELISITTDSVASTSLVVEEPNILTSCSTASTSLPQVGTSTDEAPPLVDESETAEVPVAKEPESVMVLPVLEESSIEEFQPISEVLVGESDSPVEPMVESVDELVVVIAETVMEIIEPIVESISDPVESTPALESTTMN